MSTLRMYVTDFTIHSYTWNYPVMVYGVQICATLADGASGDDCVISVAVTRGVRTTITAANDDIDAALAWLHIGRGVATAAGMYGSSESCFVPMCERFDFKEKISLDGNADEGSVGGSDFRATAVVHFYRMRGNDAL